MKTTNPQINIIKAESEEEKPIELFSNHLAPTNKMPLITTIRGNFYNPKMSVADNNGSYSFPRKPSISINGHPYIPARLVDFDGDMSRKWYIQFRVWDVVQNKLIRKRVFSYELSQILNKEERQRKGNEWAAILTDDLKHGWHSEREGKEKDIDLQTFDFHGYKLLDALKYAKEVKKNQGKAVSVFQTNITNITAFLNKNNISDKMLLRQVNHTFVSHYLNYLRDDLKLSAKTYNVRVGAMHTAIETLRKLDVKLFPTRNPFAKIDKLKAVSKKHAVYSQPQLQKLRELIAPADPQLLLFLQMIYFTLARPKEIRHLKVGHIRMDLQKILFVGEHAKTDIEEYVGMNESLARLINESGVLNYPPHYYVFTNKQVPGETPVGSSYFYKRFKKYLNQSELRKLNPNYDMYGFKHSGAVALYLATKDIYILQQQCRHTSVDQTQVYLKDLGEFTDFSVLNKWKGF